MNKLIVIGWIGSKSCYLNIPMNEAIGRYIKSNEMTMEEFHEYNIRHEEFEFDDEFSAYEVWEL